MAGLWQIRTVQNSGPSNTLENVYGYKSVLAVSNEATELLNHFISDVLPTIATVISDASSFYKVSVIEVNNPAVFADRILSPLVQGARSGDYMPNFTAWGFQYVRAVRGQRSGAKRLGPISEADVTGGNAQGSVVALLGTLATRLGAPINIGIIETWFPIILVRPKNPNDPWLSHDITSVQYARVTTQNSRKR